MAGIKRYSKIQRDTRTNMRLPSQIQFALNDKKVIKDFLLELDLPNWFRGISVFQMKAAETLLNSIRDDTEQGTAHRVRESLTTIGISPIVTDKKLKMLMQLSRGNDLAFLYFLFELCYKSNNGDFFTVNEQLILSTITHLDMVSTLRELDRLLPPPQQPKETVEKLHRIEMKKEQLQMERKLAKELRKKSIRHERLAPYFQNLIPPKLYTQPWTAKRPSMKISLGFYDIWQDKKYIVPNENNRWYAYYNFQPGKRMATRVIQDQILKAINTSYFVNKSQVYVDTIQGWEPWFAKFDALTNIPPESIVEMELKFLIRQYMYNNLSENRGIALCETHTYRNEVEERKALEKKVEKKEECLKYFDLDRKWKEASRKRVLDRLQKDVHIHECQYHRLAEGIQRNMIHLSTCPCGAIDTIIDDGHTDYENIKIDSTPLMEQCCTRKRCFSEECITSCKVCRDELRLRGGEDVTHPNASKVNTESQNPIGTTSHEQKRVLWWDEVSSKENHPSKNSVECQKCAHPQNTKCAESTQGHNNVKCGKCGGVQYQKGSKKRVFWWDDIASSDEDCGNKEDYLNAGDNIQVLDGSCSKHSNKEIFRWTDVPSLPDYARAIKLHSEYTNTNWEDNPIAADLFEGMYLRCPKCNVVIPDQDDNNVFEETALPQNSNDVTQAETIQPKVRLSAGDDSTSDAKTNNWNASQKPPCSKGPPCWGGIDWIGDSKSRCRVGDYPRNRPSRYCKELLMNTKQDPVTNKKKSNAAKKSVITYNVLRQSVTQKILKSQVQNRVSVVNANFTPITKMRMASDQRKFVKGPVKPKPRKKKFKLICDCKCPPPKKRESVFFKAPTTHTPYQFCYDEIFEIDDDLYTPKMKHRGLIIKNEHDEGFDVKKVLLAALLCGDCARQEGAPSDVDGALRQSMRNMFKKGLVDGIRKVEAEARYKKLLEETNPLKLKYTQSYFDPNDNQLMQEMLKDALEFMGKNSKFILASMKDSYKIPVLRKWICDRYGKLYTTTERHERYRRSLKMIRALERVVLNVQLKDPNGLTKIHHLNYKCLNYFKERAGQFRKDFYQDLDSVLMDQSRTFWFAMNPYLWGQGPPRNTFFAYMPACVGDIKHFGIWQPDEFMDAKSEWDLRRCKLHREQNMNSW